MAIIPLRAYNREIEGMIDNGQLDEAVAHCRHILATFPKHIASYRLLGKAHLEQQRISDATDIFQRVLSSVPDDFIANVGMSIIREDENNLDSAIWHMELAYEVQPANVAIQDELRRLYGRRDGMQPPKVRLTRGYLARMYAKGNLYDLAVAELRAAIAEDPNRPDLQLLLAEMFFQTSQRVEAVETCANLLKKIPFCLEANRILAVSLPETEGSDALRNYRQIVISMDPYYAFAAPEAISSDQVPENAVNIERLDWKSGIQIPEAQPQPNWATSLGISMEKPSDENIPEWLKSAEAPAPAPTGEKAGPTVSPFIWDTQEVQKIITDTSKPEPEIPDWMKDAGWQPASGKISAPPEVAIPEEPIEDTSTSEDIEKAEIPDWLQGIAPEGTLDEGKPAEESTESNLSTPWLEQHQPGPTDSIVHWLEDNKPENPRSRAAKEEAPAEFSQDEVPEWLKDLEPAQTSSLPATEAPASTHAFTIEPTAFIEETKLTEPESNLPEVPTPAEPAATSIDEIPDWLKDLAGEQPPVTEGVAAQAAISDETSQTPELEPATEILTPSEETPAFEQQAETEIPPAEIPAIAEEPPQTEMEEVTGEIPPVEVPEIIEQIPIVEVPAMVEEMSPEEVMPAAEQIPVDQVPAQTEEVPNTEESRGTEPLPEAEPPAMTEGAPAIEVPPSVEELTSAEVPAWIEEGSGIEPTQVSEQLTEELVPEMTEEVSATELSVPGDEQPTAETPAMPEEVPASEVPTGTEEAPLVGEPTEIEPLPTLEMPTTPEESPTSELLEQVEQAPAVELPPIPEEALATEQTLPVEGELSGAEPGVASHEDEFGWLQGLVAEQSAKDEALPTPAEGGEILPPEWVKLEAEPPIDEIIEPEGKTLEAAAPRAEEIPDWIKGLGEEPESEVAPQEPAAAVPEIEIPSSEELPAWLRELEESEPQKAETGPSEENLEWKADELPDWLKEITESEPAAEVPSPVVAPTSKEASAQVELPTSPESPAAEEAPAPVEPSVPIEIPVLEEPSPPIEVPVLEEPSPPIEVPAAEEAPVPVEPSVPIEIPVLEEPSAPIEVPAAEEAPASVEPSAPIEVPAPEEPSIPEEVLKSVEPSAPIEVPAPEEPSVPVEVPALEKPSTPIEVPAPMEATAVEGVVPMAVEPATQWSDEATPPAGIKKEALEITPVEAETWQPAVEEVVQPETAIPEEASPTLTSVSEEIVPVPAEIPAVPAEISLDTFQAVSKANQAALTTARDAINQGQPTLAVEQYNQLIKQKYHPEEIIKDLQDALYRFPVDIDMWVTLGDAYLRTDDLQEALSAYTKAEELVR